MTRIMKLNSSSNYSSLLNVVVSLVKQDKVVAIPTDTIYGLAVNVNSADAIQQLYAIKTRDFEKPLAICVAEVTEIPKYGIVNISENILNELLPGAVTVMFRRSSELNKALNPKAELVGIRVPDCDFVRDLCRQTGPIALTSANVSNQTSCLKIEEFSWLWPSLAAVVDGGPLGHVDPQRLGSTIIDFSVDGHFRIHRKGCIYDKVIQTLQKYHLKELV